MEKNIHQMTEKFDLGIDLIDIDRFRQKSFDKNQSFYFSIFFKSEIEHCNQFQDPYPHFAGIFAAKESVIKSCSFPLSINNIEIFWINKKPYVKIKNSPLTVKISISHSSTLATAIAIKYNK
jgi:phosphopantetheine--protein transferase-like protein